MTGNVKPACDNAESAAEAENPQKEMRLFTTVVRLTAYVFLRIFFRLKVYGLHNLPETGRALIACNHQSVLDPMIIGGTSKRPVRFMARDTLFRIPGFAWLIRNCNAFPVRRGGFDRQAVRASIDKLRDGRLLLVFPEGTRTEDGNIRELQSGAMMLAHQANAPIVPAVVKGAFEAWPKHRKLFRPRPISITYGEPMAPPEDGSRESYDRARIALQNRLQEMLDKAG